jgi:hypothetical protein
MCSASKTFPLGLPLRCVPHYLEGNRAVPGMRLLVSVVSVDVAYPIVHHHQRHWVNGGCVSLEHWNILCNNSVGVHTAFLTAA